MKRSQLSTSVFRLVPAASLGLVLAWFLNQERIEAFINGRWLMLYLVPGAATALILPLLGALADKGRTHGLTTTLTGLALVAMLAFMPETHPLTTPALVGALLLCFLSIQGSWSRHGLTDSAYHPAASLGLVLVLPPTLWLLSAEWRWSLPLRPLSLAVAAAGFVLFGLRARVWRDLAPPAGPSSLWRTLHPLHRGQAGLLDLRNLLSYALLFSAGAAQVQFTLWALLADGTTTLSAVVYTMALLVLMGLGALSSARIARIYGTRRLLMVAAVFSGVLVIGLHFAEGLEVAVHVCLLSFLFGLVAGDLFALVPRFSPGERSGQSIGFAILVLVVGVALGKLFALGYAPTGVPVGNTVLFLGALAAAVTVNPHRALRTLRRLESKALENPREVEWDWLEEPASGLASHTLFSRFSHVLARTIAEVFFGRLRIVGRENLRAHLGAIFVANHPNTFFDPMLVTAMAPGRLHYWAKSTFWRVPLLGSLLDQLGAIPVYRRQDAEPGSASGNERSLDLAATRLNCGAHMLIFPEGVSAQGLSLKPLKTGAARLGFATMEGRAWQTELPIIPIGLDYADPTLFRGGVTVRIGKPVFLSQYRQQYQENPQAAIAEVTRTIGKRMARLLPHLDQPSLEKLVHDIHDLYGERVLQILEKQDETTARRAIVRAVNHYQMLDPDTVLLFSQRMEAYQKERERLADDHVTPLPTTELWQLLASLFSLASFGVIANWLPYKLSGRIVAMFSVASVWIASLKLLIGMVVFGLYYLLLGLVLSLTVGLAMAIVLVFLVVFTAFLALGALDQSTFRREQLKALWHAAWTRDTNMELEEMRVSLIQDLERFREAYAFYMAREMQS